MKKPLYPVSDHAVVRYLECVRGVDVDRLRAKIGKAAEQAIDLGACGAISGGFIFKIRDGVVTTVVHQNRPDRHTDRSGVKRSRDE
ncbi:MAG: hypothetical protein COC12_08465 [Rhodobacteraceae bacterium]|nr:MAG: hypothetical protein COC12_08465 [Paracoccaceae bacterium]